MDKRVPILIIGGGPTGLTLANLLLDSGIEAIVVEADADTCDHPQAHALNRRSLEIMRSIGLDDSIREVTDDSVGGAVRFMTSLSGAVLAVVNQNSDESELIDPAKLSPCQSLSCPQDLVEPLLAKKFEAGGGEIWFSSRLLSLQQTASGVSATIDRNGEQVECLASWLVGCDGAASTTRKAVQLPMVGPEELARIVGIYFYADLDEWLGDIPSVLYWTIDEQYPATVINLGHNRWVAHVTLDDDKNTLDTFTPTRCAEVVNHIVGADVNAEIRGVRPWTMTAQIAARYRNDRVLLAGDAAHRFPPTGGFGLNTGVADAHNLAWKLAVVIRGEASETLIDTYEAERKPVAEANSEFSVINAMGMMAVMGPGAAAQGKRLADNEVTVAELSAEIQTLMDQQAAHFNAPGKEMGYIYTAGAVVTDHTALPLAEFSDLVYLPSAIPGARAPHAWVEEQGKKQSLIDYYKHGFSLVTTSGAWHPSCHELGIRVIEADDEVAALYGIDDGAVLVRPDGHVGWRCRGLPDDVSGQLSSVMRSIMCQTI